MLVHHSLGLIACNVVGYTEVTQFLYHRALKSHRAPALNSHFHCVCTRCRDAGYVSGLVISCGTFSQEGWRTTSVKASGGRGQSPQGRQARAIRGRVGFHAFVYREKQGMSRDPVLMPAVLTTRIISRPTPAGAPARRAEAPSGAEGGARKRANGSRRSSGRWGAITLPSCQDAIPPPSQTQGGCS